MIKGIANFILAVSSVSVPAVAGSMMYTYTEDKHPTTFEKLELKKIEILEDDVKTVQTKSNDKEVSKSASVVAVPKETGNDSSKAVTRDSSPSSTTQTAAPVNPTTVVAPPQPEPVTPTSPQTKPATQNLPKPQPEKPKPPESKPKPPKSVDQDQPPVKPQQPIDKKVDPSTSAQSGHSGPEPQEDNTQGIEITENILNLWISQEIASKPKTKEYWPKISEMMKTLNEEKKKNLLSEFQLNNSI